jgi:hypothetical protein
VRVPIRAESVMPTGTLVMTQIQDSIVERIAAIVRLLELEDDFITIASERRSALSTKLADARREEMLAEDLIIAYPDTCNHGVAFYECDECHSAWRRVLHCDEVGTLGVRHV